MKSQIFAGIALMIAGVVTVEVNKVKEPEIQVKEVKVLTTEELIKKSSLNSVKEEIETQEDSTSILIRETINDKIVDSVIKPKEDSLTE